VRALLAAAMMAMPETAAAHRPPLRAEAVALPPQTVDEVSVMAMFAKTARMQHLAALQ
jgi:hypothetical protein